MKQVTASVLTIGTEILIGHILDTNSRFIGNVLSGIGIRVNLKSSVGDDPEDIHKMLNYAVRGSDLILITGGLGPTNDDITKKCLSEFLGSPLKMNDVALEQVAAYFDRRGLTLTDINKKQAEMPELASVVINEMGTAPGMWIEKDNRVIVSMPGVPHEMHHMLNNHVVPMIKKRFHTPVIIHKMIMTAGIGESWLSERIAGWEKNLPEHISLAYLPGYGLVKLRLSGTSENEALLQAELNEKAEELHQIIPGYVYGMDGISLEERIGQILSERNETISLAESCTGGHIGHLITTIPGSSAYFMGGIIAYDNSIKTGLLGVSKPILEDYGAVSEETAIEMAEKCREKFGTTYAVSSTGIAGPSGGTPEKPAGTVWMAVAGIEGTVTRKINIPKDRLNVIRFASVAALILLWQQLTRKPE